jgi:hypothetical protein
MSALFDLHTSEQPEFATTPNLTAMPSTPGQRYTAVMAEAAAPDHFYNFQKAQAERYGKIIDDIHTMTGERLANPATNDATMEEIRENWGQPYPMIFQKRLDKLRTKAREVRSSMPEGGYGTEPGFLDPDMVNTQIAAESRATREVAAKLEGTGGGVGALAGGFVGSFENPFNILATFIPATRAPAWLSEQAVGLFLRNVGKETVYQGLTQGGVQAVSSAVEYGTRKPLGTEQTAGEIAGEIGGAAVFGAVIGGVARGAVPGWLKVRRMWGAGEYVPTAVKDAAITLEGKAIYGDRNPLGLSASANESALDKGMQDVALNRAADVSHIIEIMAPQRPAAEAGAQALPPVPEGMVRMFHGGENATSGGPRDVAATFDYARDFGTGDKPVWYVDVPVDSPWLRQVDITGTNMPRSFMNSVAPEEVMAGAKLVPGTEPGAPAAAAAAAAVPAAEAEKAVADARLQGAAEAAPAPAEAAPVEGARTKEVIGNEITAREDELKAKHGSDYVGYRLEAKDDPQLAALHREYDALPEVAARDAADTAARLAELDRLEKRLSEIEQGAPAQKPAAQVPPTAEPRPVAPAPEQPAGVAKPPGESPEDKAMLDQAKRMIESPEVAVPPEKRAAYAAAEKQEQEAKVAAGCLAGAI